MGEMGYHGLASNHRPGKHKMCIMLHVSHHFVTHISCEMLADTVPAELSHERRGL
jgi:hypothetical protein